MSTYMKKLNILTLTSLLILLIGILSQPTPVFASHHFESKLATTYPQFDLTDMFVFESEQRGYTTFMMNINPTTGKDGNAVFGENGVYSFHIANSKQFNGDGLTITAYLDNGKLIFGLAEGANQAIGTKGQRIPK